MLTTIQGQPEGVFYLRRVIEGHFTTPLLLVGPAGVGRRSSVIAAAKELFADDGQSFRLDQGNHPDFHFVQPEGKDVKVGAIRDMIREANFQPMYAPWKFLVVDGVDRMSDAAANALLKVLEEPPERVRFFLLAEDSERIIPTIQSRCSLVRYQRLPNDFIQTQLMAYADDAEEKALLCCRLAEGSLGQAFKFMHSGKWTLRNKALQLLKLGLSGEIDLVFSEIDALKDELPLVIRFLNQLIYDFTMLTHDPDRLLNIDLVPSLAELKLSLGNARIASLGSGLNLLRAHQDRPIRLSFHLKTLLASAFS